MFKKTITVYLHYIKCFKSTIFGASEEYMRNKTTGKELTAMLLCLCLLSCSADVHLDEHENETETADTRETTGEYSLEKPAWADAVSFNKGNTNSVSKNGKVERTSRAEAVSTMYADSFDDAFGSVETITVYAEDNAGLPDGYDIKAYKNEKKGVFYLFLPCRVDKGAVAVRALHSDGCETGVYTLNFNSDTNYGVYSGGVYYDVVAMQSSVPSLMINVTEGSMKEVNSDASHSTYCYGDMTLTVSDETAAARGWKTEYRSKENDYSTSGTMKMRGRGNWTWNQQKKPYQLTLEKKTDLLGMGKAKNYLLLANIMDASLLRDQVLYDLADDMGLAYNPDIEPVDVFIDGEYKGSYSLSEKVEVGESRVNIDEDKDFLLELDHYYMNEQWVAETPRGYHFTMHNNESYEKLGEIERIMKNIEKTVWKKDSDGWRDVLDEDSWVKYWWLQDLSRNNDTFVGSNYFYYITDEGKLYAGPVWDMDNTFGIWGGGENLMKKGWHSDDRGWLGKLYSNTSFKASLEEYYKNGGLRELFDALPDKVDSYAEYMRESAEMNYIVNKKQYFVDCGCESWDDDIEYLKDFIRERTEWYSKRIK